MLFKYRRSNLPFLRTGFCSLGLFLASGAILVAADTRTWTDSTGKNKIVGKFVSVEDGKVTLEKKDGTEVEIELKKLSAADQKFIADLEKDDPFKPKSDDPFKTKPAGGGGKSSGGGRTMPGKTSEARVVSPDYSDAAMVSPSPSGDGWKFEVPEQSPPVKVKPKLFAIPKKLDFFEGVKGFVGCPSGKFAAIGYMLQKPGGNEATTRVIVCDLEKGKMIAEGSVPGKYAPLAIHNDGSRVLMKRDEFGFGNADRLEMWTVSGKSASRDLQWAPYDDAKGGDRDIAWGSFIGDDGLATVSSHGKLVIWDPESIKAKFTLQIERGGKPAISPNQKWLAFSTGKDVGILDIAAGEVVAMQTTTQVHNPTFAFSPGMKYLGMAAADRLFVWDFATGDLFREVPYQGLGVNGNITWPSDEHVLLANRILIDLENQVRLWDYQGGEAAAQWAGMTWFLVTDGHDKPGAMLGAQLPPPAVKDQLAKQMSAPDFFVLKPGTVVKIDVSGVDPAGKDYVQKALAARLKEAGFESGPSGTIDLIAKTEISQPRQVAYTTSRRPGSQRTTYTVRDFYCKLKFAYQGKDVWQTQAGGIPHWISIGLDETLEQYLRKCEKFNFDWYGKLDLPKLLQKPSPIGGQGATVQVPTVGQTKLTTSGPR